MSAREHCSCRRFYCEPREWPMVDEEGYLHRTFTCRERLQPDVKPAPWAGTPFEAEYRRLVEALAAADQREASLRSQAAGLARSEAAAVARQIRADSEAQSERQRRVLARQAEIQVKTERNELTAKLAEVERERNRLGSQTIGDDLTIRQLSQELAEARRRFNDLTRSDGLNALARRIVNRIISIAPSWPGCGCPARGCAHDETAERIRADLRSLGLRI